MKIPKPRPLARLAAVAPAFRPHVATCGVVCKLPADATGVLNAKIR